jgi:hypothetical protein
MLLEWYDNCKGLSYNIRKSTDNELRNLQLMPMSAFQLSLCPFLQLL